MTNKIKGNSHKAICWFFNRNSMNQKGMTLYIWGYEREEPTTKNTLPSNTLLKIWWRNQKLSRQAKVERIQHHQANFTNAKGTSLLGWTHGWVKGGWEHVCVCLCMCVCMTLGCWGVLSGLSFVLFFFLATPCNLRDLCFPTRDWTWVKAVKAPNSNH